MFRNRTGDVANIRERLTQHTNCATLKQDNLEQPSLQSHRSEHVPPAAVTLAALVRPDGTPLIVVSASGDIGNITIGRGDDADLQIHESAVSQSHAQFTWDEQRRAHTLVDCGSTNGTFINRRRITGPVTLLNGMQIRLGSVLLTYQVPFHHRPERETVAKQR